MALHALRVEGIVHRVVGEYDVDDIVPDVPLPFELETNTLVPETAIPIHKNNTPLSMKNN